LPRYTALLDACVLVPIALADTLLRVAERELYRNRRWTALGVAEQSGRDRTLSSIASTA
jgi:hypothetical protein